MSQRWAALCVALLLTGAAVTLIVWRLDWGALSAFDETHAWMLVLAAALLHLLTLPLKAIAWRSTLKPALQDRPVSFGVVLGPVSVGALLNTVLVGRVGEAARAALVHARLNAGGRDAPLPAIVGSMVTESLVSTVAWVVLVAGLGLVLPLPTAVWVVLASLSLIWVMIMLAAFGSRAVSTPEEAAGIVGRVLHAVRRVWSSVMHGHRSLARIDVLAPLLLASVLGWLVQGASVYALLRAFDIASGWEAAALVLVSVTVAQTVPLLPGNVGVFQAAAALPLVSSFSVPVTTALAVGIALQLVQAAPVAIAGAMSLARGGDDIGRVYRSARRLRSSPAVGAP